MNVQVLSIYIELMRMQPHLLIRDGAKVFLEDTFVTSIIKKDGSIKMQDVLESDGTFIRERISEYLEHDLVEQPIQLLLTYYLT